MKIALTELTATVLALIGIACFCEPNFANQPMPPLRQDIDIRVAPDQHISLAALDAVRQVLRNSPHTAESPHRIHIGVDGCFDADPMSMKPYIKTSIDQQLRQIKEILRTEAPEADVQDMLSQCELPRRDALIPVSWSGLMKFTVAILPEGSLATAPWVKTAVCSGSQCSLTWVSEGYETQGHVYYH